MRHSYAFLLNIMLLSTLIFIQVRPLSKNGERDPFYLGVTFCGDTIDEAKLLIDRVKYYTNLFVLQSGPISKNETAINTICEYAVSSGLNIIVYFGWFDPECPWQIPWLDYAKNRWANHFLGVYYYDEPGGIQIDYNWSRFFNNMKQRNSSLYQTMSQTIESYLAGTLPRDYDEAAERFINSLQTNQDLKELKSRSITTFTSDYALYWFDYLGGYDVVFAEFGWNNSIVQEIALVRGAAQMQNKSWGAIITWKYMHEPYLDNGDKIYDQILAAYETGAKYVVVFNYPQIEENPYGIMFDEHFEALEQIWNDIASNKNIKHGSSKAKNLLVLPKNYGWGMRHLKDKIWYWGPDSKTPQIWDLTNNLLSRYGHKLDIIYEDPQFTNTDQYILVF